MVKLFLRIFIGTLALIVLVFTGIYFTMSFFVKPQPLGFKPTTRTFAHLLGEQLEVLPPEQVEAALGDILKERDWSHKILPADDPNLPAEITPPIYPVPTPTSVPNQYEIVFYVPIDHGNSVLVMGPILHMEGPPPGRVYIFFSIAVLVVGLAAMLVSMPTWRRIKSFELATVRLAEGDMSARAEVQGGPIGELARRFNDMADSLQNYFESQKHLLQAVSHELRTPVARIHFELELLEDEQDEVKRKSRMDGIGEHLGELNTMLDELLSFVRLDHDAPLEELETVSLKDLLEKLKRDFQLQSSEKQLRIEPAVDCSLRVNTRLFHRAMGNLIQNALRHAVSEVVVKSQLKGHHLLLTVTDDGPGIPEEARDKIFEPFARLDASRNKRSGGVGLGLAIAKRVLQRHGGLIHVEKANRGGARFVTNWPLGPTR